MQPLGRAWGWARRTWSRARGAVAHAVSGFVARFRSSGVTGVGGWELARSRRDETRWRRGPERIDCFRFDDGYVATVTQTTRGVTWQLTPGPVQLGSALAAATLYRRHGVTPQIDREGRPFIAVGEDGPRQVFEELADERVRYVYLDGIRTVEEFPEFVAPDADLRRVFERMSPARPRTLENG